MKRNTYLNVIDLNEAKAIIDRVFVSPLRAAIERVSVEAALGRVTAGPVFAKVSNPHYNAAAMDGISLNAKVTFGAHEKNPVTLKEAVDFKYVDTGDCILSEHNAVVMIEDVYHQEDGTVQVMKSTFPWEHIRVVGEDIAVGDMILPSMHKIKPVDIGALLSGGVLEVEVIKKKRVGIIPTGTEIVNPGTDLSPGDIIDSNSRVFEAMVLEAGGIPDRIDPVPDDRERLRKAILDSVQKNDIVVINAGSSAGSEDYTVGLVRELGEVFVHGIAIKPGKPTIIGQIDGKAVIGIPGYPVSAFISFREFVVPLISMCGEVKPKTAEVQLSKRVVSSLKHREYVRMKIGRVGERLIATPLSRGAGVTMSLVKADGILEVPQNVEGYESGQIVPVTLLKSEKSIDKSLVSIGSHDIIMDYLNDMMTKDERGFTLSSAHVGSLGGIMAVKRGETHLAPTHLLDEKTGVYNVPFIKKYLKGEAVYLIKGIKRWQGFYVEKGNPHGVSSLKDLIEKNLILANRQRGSGTRALLDYQLKQEGYSGDAITGYQKEYTTHTNVALAVQSGNSDVGLGIKSVANMMNLDFVPLALEDYDFMIPEKYLDDARTKRFVELLQTEAFRVMLEQLGGYEFENIVWQVIQND